MFYIIKEADFNEQLSLQFYTRNLKFDFLSKTYVMGDFNDKNH